MVLRTGVLGDYAVDLPNMWRIEGSFLMYKEGQSFLDYVASHVGGTGKIGQLFDVWPRKQNLEQCSLDLWGKPLAELGREWFGSLKRRYYPLVTSRKEAADFAKPLTARGDFNLRGCVVPGSGGDSLKVVHFSDYGDYPGVWTWQRRGSAADQRRLVRAGNHHGYESLHFFQTRLDVNRKGQVALVSRRGSRDVIHVLHGTDGRELRTLENPDLLSLSSPSWSPGGDSLVVRGQGLAGDADIYLVDARANRWTALTRDAYDDKDPVFDPDGASITFCSERGADGRFGRYHLYRRSPAGALTALTTGPGSESEPAYSPDGKRLAFVSDRGGIPDLYLYDAAKGVAPLTHVQGAAWDPSWESDSRHLVFSQFAGGRFQMFEFAVADTELEWRAEKCEPQGGWSPPLAAEDTRIGPYRRHWGVGLVQTSFASDPDVGGGSAGQLALQDLLGNEQVNIFVNSTGQGLSNLIENLDLGATYLNQSKRLTFGGGAFRLNQIYDSRLDLVRNEHRTGGLLLASYPLTRFDRLETSVVLRHAENHFFSDGTVGGANLVSHYLTFVHDNAWLGQHGFSAGWRFYVSGGQTRDLRRGKGNFWSLRFDQRRYFEILPGMTFAARVRGEFVNGEDAEPVFAGGFGDLRGYPRRYLVGRSIAVASQELRFPVIRSLVLSLPGGGLRLPSIMGALYADAAAYDAGRPVQSVGGSLYMGGGYFPALRFDFSKRHGSAGWQRGMTTQFGIGFNY